MEVRGKIVYEFEHADTMHRLAAKIKIRTRNGWTVTGEPREIAVQLSETEFTVRYCQTFYRHSDESISREPWLTRVG